MALFHDRTEAGQILAEHLGPAVKDTEPFVLALPRGGVPVGVEVAKTLGAALDVFVVRKLGTPLQEELAFGAVASGGTRVLDQALIEYLNLSEEVIERITERELKELVRRERLYREDRGQPGFKDRTLVVVDDGLATGASMLAAARALRERGAGRIVVAVPVAARPTLNEVRKQVDEVVCVATPHPFGAVGLWYEDFSEVTDEGVRRALETAAHDFMARRLDRIQELGAQQLT